MTTSARAPPPKGTASEHSRRVLGRDHTGSKRFNLAPVQKFGRSLMLPIAALPAAALLLRLGQPDLLGADGLGWDQRRRRHRRRRQRAVREPGVAVRGRRRDRHGQEGRRLDRARRGGRLPRLQGRRRRDVAVRARRRRPRGGSQELINYGVLGGIVMGLTDGVPLAALPPDQAAAVPRVLRRPPVRPDHHRRSPRSWSSVLMSLVYPAFDAGLTSDRRVGDRELRHRRLRLRHAQPAADPARPAPHPELRPVVRLRRLRRTPTASTCTATSRASCTATRPRARS